MGIVKLDSTALAFFYANAGYGIAEGESDTQGRMRAALDLARAERTAKRRNWVTAWVSDWGIPSHVAEYPDAYDAEPESCELAKLVDVRGNVLASIGCIDDADDDCRRMVAAGLALEAITERRARKARKARERGCGTACQACKATP